MTHTLQGINLGGWLVAERWMTPALFEGVEGRGEAELVRQLGKKEAIRRLTRHRNTFIQEKDIIWLVEHGITVVRVPVGYWLFKETRDYVSGEKYLVRLFKWAKRHGMSVIIDFHGLVGSQNGRDHSGSVGPAHFYRRQNRQATLEILTHIVQTYGQHPCLIGIEVINEPRWSFFGIRLLGYYRQAYKIIAQATAPSVKVIVSDGFHPRITSLLLGWARLGERLVMDVHLYQAFLRPDSKKDEAAYLRVAHHGWTRLLNSLTRCVPIMVGEWSAASQLVKPSSSFPAAYYKVQQQTFNECAWAQCYWSYKAPGQGVWDFASQSRFHKK